jgi:hypothetical protein
MARRILFRSRPGGGRLIQLIQDYQSISEGMVRRSSSPPPPPTGNAYWVSPEGTALYAAARSDTPLPLAQCTTLARATAGAVAGDVVYFRGGTYSVTGSYREAFKPAGSGTGISNRVVFMAYPGETPIVDGAGSVNSYGLVLSAKSYTKIDGIRFKNFYQWAVVNASSHHNEVARSWFYSDTGEDVTFGFRISGGCLGGGSYTCPSTHNWIHHCVLHTMHESQTTWILNEGSDAFCIGSDNNIYGDNNNTFEDNIVYEAGHTCFESYGMYTVIRNNVFHNPPFWDDDSVGRSTTLTADAGPADTTLYVANAATIGQADFLWGRIVIDGEDITYSSRTATTLTGCGRGRSGSTAASHSTGATVQAMPRYHPDMYTNPAYRGKFSHRAFTVSDGGDRLSLYDLIEGNRIGHAGANPNNNGADGMDLAGPRNIARFNTIYANMHCGMMFKYGQYALGGAGSGGIHNRFYNNTIYESGYGNPRYELADDDVSTAPESLLAIRFYTSDVTIGNHVKNNIVYKTRRQEMSGFEIGCGASAPVLPPQTVVENNWWTPDGDPLFVDPDTSDAWDFTAPDLSLQASSPCIGAGGHLTHAVGAGSGSVTITLPTPNDAWYFQDGTWGSDLARLSAGLGGTLRADWIAVGTVGNVAQISSVNYITGVVTLATPLTWADDAPIWLYMDSSGRRVLYGTAPDLGAHPYPR